MKHFFVLTLLLFGLDSYTQNPCYINEQDDLYFTSQEAIDNFIINYPNCTHTVGDLIIYGEDITNLYGLSNIVHVGGALVIGSTNPNYETYLHDFSGLENLDSVSGPVAFYCLDSLESFSGLESIGPTINSLWLESVRGITDLNGLEFIEYICSYFRLRDNPDLVNFEGLNNLDSIGGDFEVGVNNGSVGNEGNNISIENFNGLDNLKKIGGDFEVRKAESLINFEGLEQLKSIGLRFNVFENESLENFEGLSILEEIGWNFSLGYNIELQSYIGLNNLKIIGGSFGPNENTVFEGLENLERIEGSFNLGFESSIENFIGLENLNQIGGNLRSFDNTALISFEGLNALDTIGASLWILGNNSLLSFNGLDNLVFVNSIKVYENEVLNDVNSLQNIDWSSPIELRIYHNPALEICTSDFVCHYLNYSSNSVQIENNGSQCEENWLFNNSCEFGSCLENGIELTSQEEIDDFANTVGYCDHIIGDVLISGNDITNLDGLFVIKNIDGSLKIQNNPILESIEGLSFLESIGGTLVIKNNENLNELTGLNSVIYTSGAISIENNNSLDLDSGLESLVSVNGDLNIINNESIQSLLTLLSLESINGDLRVENNSSLSSLKGLRNIDPSGMNNLYINNNSSLSTCDYESICNYISDPSGIISIGNNAQNCNSLQEVEVACEFGYCYLNGITFSNQLEVENFPVNNPTCDVIEGNVSIIEDDITGLDSLYRLVKIEGDLSINHTDNLVNMDGLQNLTEIGGSFKLDYLFHEHNLDGLDNLSTIGDLFELDRVNIIDFSGVSSLSNVNSIKIGYCPDLQNLDGLENINHIQGWLGIGDLLLSFSSPIHLNNLQGLSNLISVNGGIFIGGTEALADLEGLNNLQFSGSLHVRNNGALTDLNGLENLGTIKEDLIIRDNIVLNDLSSLSLIDSIGDLVIRDNPLLENLEGLNNISIINGKIQIISNEMLIDISALAQIQIDSLDEIIILNNAQLSVCGIQPICDFISISPEDVNIISNANGCASLDEVILSCDGCYPGGITFYQQAQIDSFSNLTQECSIIWGDLIISGEDIQNLNGLINIETVLGDLKIYNNQNLANLDGLNNLTTISNNDLIIYNNPNLTSITGLSNLTDAYFNYLEILDNESLNNCSIQSVCSHFNYFGDYLVNNNNGNCYDDYELILSCGILNEGDSPFQLFPNPTGDILNIASIINAVAEQITIFDQIGAPVYFTENPDELLDLSSLDPGIYIVQILSEGIFYQELLLIN